MRGEPVQLCGRAQDVVHSSRRFDQHHVTDRHLFASGGYVDEHAGRRADLEF